VTTTTYVHTKQSVCDRNCGCVYNKQSVCDHNYGCVYNKQSVCDHNYGYKSGNFRGFEKPSVSPPPPHNFFFGAGRPQLVSPKGQISSRQIQNVLNKCGARTG